MMPHVLPHDHFDTHDHSHDHGHSHEHDQIKSTDAPTPLPPPATGFKRVLYIDTFGGVAGDMLLAALLDAGAPFAQVEAGLKTMRGGVQGEWGLRTERVLRSEGCISALKVHVDSKYGHKAEAPPGALSRAERTVSNSGSTRGAADTHDHDHSHGHGHDHQQGHGHDSGSPHGPSRNLRDIKRIIKSAVGLAGCRKHAIAAFQLLAEAERATHGAQSVDEVHFHEVGAIDSIVDTVGVCLALRLLGIDEVYCSPLPLGSGTVRTAHGLLPVPAPATLRLMLGVPTRPGPPVEGELCTPTGVALLRALVRDDGKHWNARTPNGFVPTAVGLGAGSKDFPGHPNVVRVIVGTAPCPPSSKEDTEAAAAAAFAAAARVGSSFLGGEGGGGGGGGSGGGGGKGAETAAEAVQEHSHEHSHDHSQGHGHDHSVGAAVAQKPSAGQIAAGGHDWLESCGEEFVVVESNLDDITAEQLSFAVEQLLGASGRALDAWTVPITMKKGRGGAAVTLCALAR